MPSEFLGQFRDVDLKLFYGPMRKIYAVYVSFITGDVRVVGTVHILIEVELLIK